METDLFVGVQISNRLQTSLDSASLPFRRYFEGGKFLTIVECDDGCWLGKPIPRSSSPDRLDDMKRHVHSVIRKIDPGVKIPFERVKIIDMPPEPVVEPETEAADEVDAAGAVDAAEAPKAAAEEA